MKNLKQLVTGCGGVANVRGWPPNKRMQRAAAALSIVRNGRKVGSFAEHQQLAERAPLMRMPLGGA